MASKEKAKNSKKPYHSPQAEFEGVGPTSIEGVEASDLPGEGRGSVFTDPGKEGKRNLPQNTGERSSGATGLRGDPDLADADEHGGRGAN